MSGKGSGSPADPGFWAWYDAREPTLLRLAFLLTLDAVTARNLLLHVLAPTAAAWSRVGVDRADEQVLGDLVAALRHDWAAGVVPSPQQLPASGDPLADDAWALLCDLDGPDRAAVVLVRHEGLDPDEAGRLTGAGAAAAQDAVDSLMDELDRLVEETVRRRPARLLPSPDQLLDDVLVERPEAASLQPVPREELATAASALRHRRRLVVGGAVTALLIVVGSLAVSLGSPGWLGADSPAPAQRVAFEGRPVLVPQAPLARYDASGDPRVPYLVADELHDPDLGRTTLPVANPGVAVRRGREVFVTDLRPAGDEQLVRVTWDGEEVGRAPTVGEPVVTPDRSAVAWLHRRDDGRVELRMGGRRQPVDPSATLVGATLHHVVLNDASGVWVTDLRSPPWRLTGLRRATSVASSGLVSAVTTDGDGAIVDLEGRVRWSSRDWLPGPVSPDGRYVVAAGATRARLVHAFLDARTGRLVREVHWGDAVPRVIDQRWEDPRHLLLVAADLGRTAILRVDLRGRVTRATRPARVDIAGFSLYRFADG